MRVGLLYAPSVPEITMGLNFLDLKFLEQNANFFLSASIQYLRGAELAVLQVSSNRQICVQFDFQNNLPLQVRPDGSRVSVEGSDKVMYVTGVFLFCSIKSQAISERNRILSQAG